MLPRVRAIAASQAIDISAIEPVLSAVDPAPGARVSLLSEFRRLSVAVPVSAPPPHELLLARRRLDALGPGFVAQRGWLPALLEDDSRAIHIEVETIPDRDAVAFAVRAVGARDADEDLRFLSEHAGLDSPTLVQLAGLVDLIGGFPCLSLCDRCGPPALHTWTLEFPLPWSSDDQRRAAFAAADEVARVFDLSSAQRRLAAEVHAFLLGAEACSLSLVTCRDEVLPYAELAYRRIQAQAAVRVMGGLFPDHRCATRVGALVTAASADAVASLRLRLGDGGGIRARISVDLGSA